MTSPPLPIAPARRALVVGSSSGIGLALARRLVRDGWRVTGVSRSASALDDAAYEHAVLDVRAPDYRAALAALLARAGPLDVCAYCAGVGDALDLADLARQTAAFEVNLMGAVATAELVLPAMLAAGRGHFVVLSSLADTLISPDAPGYNASKAAVSSYFEGLALALRPRGVAVTNVRFGFVDTKMAKAPVRPFMVSPDRAADVIARCLATRPVRRSFPLRMAALVWLLGWVTRARVWLG